MAKPSTSNNRIPLLGQIIDIIDSLQTRIGTIFRKIHTQGPWSSNSTLKTVTKISQNGNGDITEVKYESIPNVTEPPSSGTKVSATQGLVKLQDTVDTNRTNAVTPNAVKEALDGFKSYKDANWLMQACDDGITDTSEYGNFHYIAIQDINGAGAEDYAKFMDLMNTIFNDYAPQEELVIGINGHGTFYGYKENDVPPYGCGLQFYYGFKEVTADGNHAYQISFKVDESPTTGENLYYRVMNLTQQMPTLADVATTGSFYDLVDYPTIPAAPGTLNTNNSTAQTVSSSEALSGTVKLHKVSKTGSYNDLLNTPTIPSAPGTLNTNNTTAQTASSSEALSGTVNLHKVSKTGSYNDLLNTPTIPSAPGTLNTNNTTAQTASSSESLSGTVKLHKVSKTGSYNDLLNTPTVTPLYHRPYRGSLADITSLYFAGESGSKTYVRKDNISTSDGGVDLGMLVPEPNSWTGGNVLKIGSNGELVWASPLPAYDTTLDLNKVLMIRAHAQGGGNVYADWGTNTKTEFRNITGLTAAEAAEYCSDLNVSLNKYIVPYIIVTQPNKAQQQAGGSLRLYFQETFSGGGGSSSGSTNWTQYIFTGVSDDGTVFKKSLHVNTFTPSGGGTPTVTSTWYDLTMRTTLPGLEYHQIVYVSANSDSSDYEDLYLSANRKYLMILTSDNANKGFKKILKTDSREPIHCIIEIGVGNTFSGCICNIFDFLDEALDWYTVGSNYFESYDRGNYYAFDVYIRKITVDGDDYSVARVTPYASTLTFN